MVKRVGKYELGRTLGEGTFGKVKYAVNTETNEAVAIKVLDKEKIQKQNMGNQIKKEISIMKMVKHKYIVSLVEVLASKTKIFIVLELVTGGELFDKIVSCGKLSEVQARFYFCQLLEGLSYCHKMGVCHRDLKPENLLLDDQGNLKISDFGLSSLYVGDAEGDGATRTQLLHTTCGTPNYVAPEVLSDQGYDGKKADVWSMGVILYVLIAGFLPFDESTIVALFKKIKVADFTYPSWFSPEVRSVLDTMLVADPKVRHALAQIADHPWVRAAYDGNNNLIAPNSNRPLVKHISGIVASALMDKNGGPGAPVDEEDDDEDEGNTTSKRKPQALLAFDLLSRCGGFLLDRLGPRGASANSSTGMTMASRFGQHRQSHISRYTSPIVPASMLLQSVLRTLVSMGFEFQGPVEKISAQGRARGSKVTANGAIGIIIEVFSVGPSVSMIEIQKGKGDLLQWNTLLQEILIQCKDFLNVKN